MGDSPQRIWIEAGDDCPYFYEESELTEAGSPVTEYIRADLAILSALEPSAARELALEEAARVAEQFRNNDWIAHDMRTGVSPKQSEPGVAIAAAIRALSSPDHSDAGKFWNDTHPSGGDRHGE